MDEIIVLADSLSISDNSPSLKINDSHADVVVNTDTGQIIRTHKSVLKCCPYFSAMLQGNWIENQTSSFKISGSLELVINHLYEPLNEFKDDLDLAEILALADMLGIESLVSTTITRIITKICHNFHRPCQDCIPGVISCLQLASRLSILDLEKRCISWISKHFAKIWKTRHFASLSKSHQSQCLDSIVNTIDINSVMNLLLETQQLQNTLPSVKWTEPISDMNQKLRRALTEYLEIHYSDAIESSWFKNLHKCDEWHIKCVQQQLADAAETLPVEQACRSYVKLTNLIESYQQQDGEQLAQYLHFLSIVHKALENRIAKRVAMATKCASWNSLPKAKQNEILQLGFFSPIDNPKSLRDAANKSNSSRTKVKRHISLDEPSETVNQVLSQPQQAEANATVRSNLGGTSRFQRNALRSTAPHVRRTSSQPVGSPSTYNSRLSTRSSLRGRSLCAPANRPRSESIISHTTTSSNQTRSGVP